MSEKYHKELVEDALDQGLIQHLHQSDMLYGTILTINGDGPYSTPAALLDLGVYNCSSCNYMNSIDNQKCRHCNETKFIIKK